MIQPAGLIPRLELLSAGAGPPVVVVDFVPFSSAGRLGQLLSAHRDDQQIYQLEPVTDLAAYRDYLPLSELADSYADALDDAGITRRPAIVVGYCSAATVTLEITSRLARQCAASAVLVAPTCPDSATIEAEYARFLANLGDTAPGLLGCADDGDQALYQKMRRRLAEALRAMAAASGLDASSAAFADMLAQYSAWLGFLLASRQAEPRWRAPSAPAFPVRILGVSEDAGDLGISPDIAREILDPRCRTAHE